MDIIKDCCAGFGPNGNTHHIIDDKGDTIQTCPSYDEALIALGALAIAAMPVATLKKEA